MMYTHSMPNSEMVTYITMKQHENETTHFANKSDKYSTGNTYNMK